MLAASLLCVGCDVLANHGPPHYTYGPEPTENQHIFPARIPDAGCPVIPICAAVDWSRAVCDAGTCVAPTVPCGGSDVAERPK